MARALALTLALFALVFVVARVRYAPPPPLPLDAPEERFSAGRARQVQARVVGDGATRWVGTEGNARARAVIVAELERLGWKVEEPRRVACSRFGRCAPVTNVVAELAGREPELPAVLLSAHYDSVPVSPGASDDGVGVATVLETARALAEGPRPRRSVIALLADAEEPGLLGAEAFASAHRLANRYAFAINVDARGSRGPSTMFEASDDDRAVIGMMAAELPRPVTSSLYFEVYRRMPNDTDFSVTKRGALGLNFANVAGVEAYHSPLDTMEAADPGTLQHHGEHVLAMARTFAGAGPPSAHGRAVWFDVLALRVVAWPAEYTLGLALAAVALIAIQWLRRRESDRGLAVFFLTVPPGAIAAAIVGWALRAAGALPAPWVAYPLPALVALEAAGAAGVLATSLLLARRASPRALYTGTWLGWALAGVALAVVAPGASYLFVVPALVAGLAGFFPLAVACVLPAAAAAVLVLAISTGLHDAVGFAVPPIVVVPTILLTSTLSPMLVGLPRALGTRAPAALWCVALASGIVAAVAPKFSQARPQRVNVVFRQDDGAARVFVDTSWGPAKWGEPPPAMLAALGPPLRFASALPWTSAAPFVEAPPIDAEPPSAEILSVTDVDGRRRVRARLRSRRGAPSLSVASPAERGLVLTVDGAVAPGLPVASVVVVGLLAVPTEGVLVDLEAPGAEPIAITLMDVSWGVPPGTKADAAVRARPADALPFQDGDLTVLTRALSL